MGNTDFFFSGKVLPSVYHNPGKRGLAFQEKKWTFDLVINLWPGKKVEGCDAYGYSRRVNTR